jgi:hypothetical protein
MTFSPGTGNHHKQNLLCYHWGWLMPIWMMIAGKKEHRLLILRIVVAIKMDFERRYGRRSVVPVMLNM